jgi:two-component SAPR family response regulator
MKTILVDDEPLAMLRFQQLTKNNKHVEILGTFDNPFEALKFLIGKEIDLCVLDIEMPGLSGIELAEKIKIISPDTQIVFITGYQQYALSAYGVHACAYIIKPYIKEQINYAINTAKLLLTDNNRTVEVKAFGQFDIFIDKKPVFFKSAKAKELLAYLVDQNGGTVSTGLAISMLWEDKPYSVSSRSLYYKVVNSLEKTLDSAGISYIVIKTKHEICLNQNFVDCDYHNYLSNKDLNKLLFKGEYMNQYSWGEETLATLFRNENK